MPHNISQQISDHSPEDNFTGQQQVTSTDNNVFDEIPQLEEDCEFLLGLICGLKTVLRYLIFFVSYKFKLLPHISYFKWSVKIQNHYKTHTAMTCVYSCKLQSIA